MASSGRSVSASAAPRLLNAAENVGISRAASRKSLGGTFQVVGAQPQLSVLEPDRLPVGRQRRSRCSSASCAGCRSLSSISVLATASCSAGFALSLATALARRRTSSRSAGGHGERASQCRTALGSTVQRAVRRRPEARRRVMRLHGPRRRMLRRAVASSASVEACATTRLVRMPVEPIEPALQLIRRLREDQPCARCLAGGKRQVQIVNQDRGRRSRLAVSAESIV